MRAIAIIPARGGSKRLPGKNMVPFLGKPMISHTIGAAMHTGVFQRVVVSTEDPNIEKTARRFGAQVHRRPPWLATDQAQVVEVCLQFLQQEHAEGRQYDILCCLYATAPLRNADDIRCTVRLVEQGECDFAMAVTEYYYPPHQALRESDSGFLEPMWPEIVNLQSQALPRMLIDNGSTYAVSVPVFLEVRSFYGPRLKGYRMPRDRSVDIDLKEDLELAQFYATRTRP